MNQTLKTTAFEITNGEDVMAFGFLEVGEEIIGEIDWASILQVLGLLECQHTNECVSER